MSTHSSIFHLYIIFVFIYVHDYDKAFKYFSLVHIFVFLYFQDYAKAFKYFSLASDQGWVDGQLQLGIMYFSEYIYPMSPASLFVCSSPQHVYPGFSGSI